MRSTTPLPSVDTDSLPPGIYVGVDTHRDTHHVAAVGLATPKQRDGLAESIRMLLAERTSAAKARTAAINQIHAQLVTAPEAVRADFRRYEGARLLEVVARTRPGRGVTPDHVCRLCLKRLAHRAQELAREIEDIDTDPKHLTRISNPALMSVHGIGPVVAGTLLATLGDNPDRVGTKAQFAALCGVAPIPASSGVRPRHRLSRGGDRQANASLHRIVLSRRRHKDPRTMAYFDKRRAEGLSDRDIVRCLKRHVTNEIFTLLTHPEISTQQGPLLRQRRQALQLAMTEVAIQLGVPHQRLRRLEMGERSDSELQNAYQIWLDNHTQRTAKPAQKAA
ncbi:transposase [Homoserinimonas sp. OAct 916]|uniref:transposase n=1 Tax=Homoserinimonas sp. OAct 916 TaxID=2211450 RepID=UPI000DBE8362|nr:transposase [Homoserinimonas sp. OAct 916]